MIEASTLVGDYNMDFDGDELYGFHLIFGKCSGKENKRIRKKIERYGRFRSHRKYSRASKRFENKSIQSFIRNPSLDRIIPEAIRVPVSQQ